MNETRDFVMYLYRHWANTGWMTGLAGTGAIAPIAKAKVAIQSTVSAHKANELFEKTMK